MCGISVFFHKHSISKEFYDRFTTSLHKIAHRGPDDEGVVVVNTKNGNYKIIKTRLTHPELPGVSDLSSVQLSDYNLILGHRRLSIIDLSVMGHQPMKNSDNSWIVFNGEIYNYIEVRNELKSLGSSFKTGSDTEVILEAYKLWGSKCFEKFNGMWSIVIWDNLNKTIVTSNDRFGVKPLYYITGDDFFVLGSELKQWNSYHDWHGGLGKEFFNDFLEQGYLDISLATPYKNIKRFPGSYVSILHPGQYNTNALADSSKPYYKLEIKERKWKEQDAIEEFRFLIHDAVKLRMRSDVKFGFALSGGIDSSAILYAARNVLKDVAHEPIEGFSAVFPGYDNADESRFTDIVANDLPCTANYSLPMEEFTMAAFEEHIYHQDEPIDGTSYFAEWSVYHKARSKGVKILFNGQGADEVFAGYHHHFYRYCRELLLKGKIAQCRLLITQYAELKGLPRKQVATTVMNELKLALKIKTGLKKYDHGALRQWNSMDHLEDMLMADFKTFQLPLYLRADDRDSMCFSIESRHPFMDYRLVEFGYSLPNDLRIKNGWQKYIIREAMKEMPESIRYRRDKKGFLTPESVWLEKYKNEFDSYLAYNEKIFGKKHPSQNLFNDYSLGAWLKTNGF